ncbi:hypothetical protein KCP70_24685 [Salmonella enterica subsp. enterica]|nr:hypothetical protein KCP70_24685 [Salmonella enterica subsp. enterica]
MDPRDEEQVAHYQRRKSTLMSCLRPPARRLPWHPASTSPAHCRHYRFRWGWAPAR